MMDGLEIVSKMQKLIKDRLQSVGDTMITGGVDNMEEYKYILGQIRTYEFLLQEISNLLNKKELNADAGNVIKLD